MFVAAGYIFTFQVRKFTPVRQFTCCKHATTTNEQNTKNQQRSKSTCKENSKTTNKTKWLDTAPVQCVRLFNYDFNLFLSDICRTLVEGPRPWLYTLARAQRLAGQPLGSGRPRPRVARRQPRWRSGSLPWCLLAAAAGSGTTRQTELRLMNSWWLTSDAALWQRGWWTHCARYQRESLRLRYTATADTRPHNNCCSACLCMAFIPSLLMPIFW